MMRKILMVDDNYDLLEIIRTYFSFTKTFEPVCFTNVKDALEYLDEAQPDVIVSDLIMPDMNGAEFHEEVLKRIPNPPPFITMTGLDASDVGEIPGVTVLEKPFDLDDLSKLIDQVIVNRINATDFPDSGFAHCGSTTT